MRNKIEIDKAKNQNIFILIIISFLMLIQKQLSPEEIARERKKHFAKLRR